jgi:hypothetical protein
MQPARRADGTQEEDDSGVMFTQGWRELDAYATLKVHPHAPRDLIAEAYWLLVTRAREQQAPEPYVRHLNHSYELLCDDERRRRYDDELGVPAPRPELPATRRGLLKRSQHRRPHENHYQLLRVDAAASHEVIDLAYKMLARQYRHSGGTERLGWIEEAYATLSNPQRRAQYDEKLFPRGDEPARIPVPELPVPETKIEATVPAVAESTPEAPAAAEDHLYDASMPLEMADGTPDLDPADEVERAVPVAMITSETAASPHTSPPLAELPEEATVAPEEVNPSLPVSESGTTEDETHPSLLRRWLRRHGTDDLPATEIAEVRVVSLADESPEDLDGQAVASESDPSVDAPCAELVFTIGPLTGFRVPLARDGVVFGSDAQCDIVLAEHNGDVRPRHARVGLMGDGYLLHQLDTFGIIRVNGEAIGRQLVILEPGDTVAIGAHAFTFQTPGDTRAARAVSA